MATTEQIAELKGMLGAAVGNLTDEQLGALIDDNEGNLNRIAESVWGNYASSTASLVNISESGSSRSLGDVHKNALSMAKYYKELQGVEEPSASGRPRTRPMRRE